MSTFANDIEKFNSIYKLPVNKVPTTNVGVPMAERLKAFKDILLEEVSEIDEIISAAEGGSDELTSQYQD